MITKKNSQLYVILMLEFFILFCFTLITLSYFPIYPDEIASRLWISRTLFDFPLRTNLFPACESYIQSLSVVWYVPGVIENIVHGFVVDLFTLRIIGIISYLLMFGLLVNLFMISYNNIRYAYILKLEETSLSAPAIVLSLISIGVAPFFLVTNRQEQIILISLLALLNLLLFTQKKTPRRLASRYLIAISYIFFTTLIWYAHPKGLLLSPIIFAIGFYLLQSLFTKKMSYILLILITWLMWMNYAAWSDALKCQSSPTVNQAITSYNVDLKNIKQHPLSVISQLRTSAFNVLKEVDEIRFQAQAELNYLPPINLNIFDYIVNQLIFFNCIGISCWIICILLLRANQHNENQTVILVYTFIISEILNISINLTKNWYDSGYTYMLLIITFIYSLTRFNNYPFARKQGQAFLSYFVLCSIMSLLLLNYHYFSALKSGYNGPGISLANYHYNKLVLALKKAEQTCEIDTANDQGIIVDDLTYGYFQHAKHPILITYLFYPETPTLKNKLISSNKISGTVVRCTSLPVAIRANARQNRDLCCFTKNQTKRIFNIQ